MKYRNLHIGKITDLMYDDKPCTVAKTTSGFRYKGDPVFEHVPILDFTQEQRKGDEVPLFDEQSKHLYFIKAEKGGLFYSYSNLVLRKGELVVYFILDDLNKHNPYDYESINGISKEPYFVILIDKLSSFAFYSTTHEINMIDNRNDKVKEIRALGNVILNNDGEYKFYLNNEVFYYKGIKYYFGDTDPLTQGEKDLLTLFYEKWPENPVTIDEISKEANQIELEIGSYNIDDIIESYKIEVVYDLIPYLRRDEENKHRWSYVTRILHTDSYINTLLPDYSDELYFEEGMVYYGPKENEIKEWNDFAAKQTQLHKEEARKKYDKKQHFYTLFGNRIRFHVLSYGQDKSFNDCLETRVDEQWNIGINFIPKKENKSFFCSFLDSYNRNLELPTVNNGRLMCATFNKVFYIVTREEKDFFTVTFDGKLRDLLGEQTITQQNNLELYNYLKSL